MSKPFVITSRSIPSIEDIPVPLLKMVRRFPRKVLSQISLSFLTPGLKDHQCNKCIVCACAAHLAASFQSDSDFLYEQETKSLIEG